MRKLAFLRELLPLVLLLLAACGGRQPSEEGVVRLEFSAEPQNLEVIRALLRTEPRRGTEVCPRLAGTLRHGEIPYRLPGEGAASSRNFVRFAAAYGHGDRPALRLDLDRDGTVGCDEEVPLLRHPERPETAFRTLRLGDGDGESRRVRLSLPTRLGDHPGADFYTLDLVDVPVARWRVDGRETLWILFDGNYDGVFDGRFGDALLIDVTGERRLSTAPRGESFYSLHLPLALPWGTYEVADLDPFGRFLTLRPLPAETAEALEGLEIGERVEDLGCRDLAGSEIRLGGAERHQILYFWLSGCGSCESDMGELPALLERFGGERLDAVGISLDEDPDAFRDFVERHDPAWPQCYVGATYWDNALARRLGVTAPSEFVLLGPKGEVLSRGRGIRSLRRVLTDTFPEERLDGGSEPKSIRAAQER